MVTRPTVDARRVTRALCRGLVMVALVHPTSSLRAQAIRGTLVEAGTGMPVDGAAVVLLDEADTQISWWLTDPAGRFSFILQSSGTFRLRVDRIGLTSIRSDLIVVEGKETVVYRLETPVEAVVLAGLTVESSRRCEVRTHWGYTNPILQKTLGDEATLEVG